MSTFLLTAALAALLQGTSSEDAPAPAPWPDYRGPAHDGAAPDAAPPTRWGERADGARENVAWRTAVHGRGWSSPVVGGGRVWMTTADPDGHVRSVVALELEDGSVLVDRVLFEVPEPQHRNALNSYASPSPTLGEGRVYAHFGAAGTACLDAATGATLWERRDLVCDHMEGAGSSPLLHDGLLVLNVDGADVQYVVALDADTGETVWRTDRTAPLDHLAPDLRKAYSTPIVVRAGEREELVSSGAQATVAYDPRTGVELWTVLHDGFSMSSRPVFDGERVHLNTGFMRPRLVAVRPGGDGDVTATHVAWSTANGVPTMPSPVLHAGLLYQVSDGGVATCLEAATGDVVWKERVGGEYSASPVLAGEHLYLFDREGRGVVLRAGRTFEVVAENELEAGCMASPAVVGDTLVVRTETHVYRLAEDARPVDRRPTP